MSSLPLRPGDSNRLSEIEDRLQRQKMLQQINSSQEQAHLREQAQLREFVDSIRGPRIPSKKEVLDVLNGFYNTIPGSR